MPMKMIVDTERKFMGQRILLEVVLHGDSQASREIEYKLGRFVDLFKEIDKDCFDGPQPKLTE